MTVSDDSDGSQGPPLFVRVNGQLFLYGVLDWIVRVLAERAGVALPRGAAAHSRRHRYGTTLALSGVHRACSHN